MFKKKKPPWIQPHAEQLGERLARTILRLQKRLANWMNRRFSRLNNRERWALLWAVSLLFGGYCIYLLFLHLFNLFT